MVILISGIIGYGGGECDTKFETSRVHKGSCGGEKSAKERPDLLLKESKWGLQFIDLRIYSHLDKSV